MKPHIKQAQVLFDSLALKGILIPSHTKGNQVIYKLNVPKLKSIGFNSTVKLPFWAVYLMDIDYFINKRKLLGVSNIEGSLMQWVIKLFSDSDINYTFDLEKINITFDVLGGIDSEEVCYITIHYFKGDMPHSFDLELGDIVVSHKADKLFLEKLKVSPVDIDYVFDLSKLGIKLMRKDIAQVVVDIFIHFFIELITYLNSRNVKVTLQTKLALESLKYLN